MSYGVPTLRDLPGLEPTPEEPLNKAEKELVHRLVTHYRSSSDRVQEAFIKEIADLAVIEASMPRVVRTHA